jgi:hypothetical protein
MNAKFHSFLKNDKYLIDPNDIRRKQVETFQEQWKIC